MPALLLFIAMHSGTAVSGQDPVPIFAADESVSRAEEEPLARRPVPGLDGPTRRGSFPSGNGKASVDSPHLKRGKPNISILVGYTLIVSF